MSGVSGQVNDGSVTPGTAYKWLNWAVVSCNRQSGGEDKGTTLSFLQSSAGLPAAQANAVYDNAMKSFCGRAQ